MCPVCSHPLLREGRTLTPPKAWTLSFGCPGAGRGKYVSCTCGSLSVLPALVLSTLSQLLTSDPTQTHAGNRKILHVHGLELLFQNIQSAPDNLQIQYNPIKILHRLRNKNLKINTQIHKTLNSQVI